MKIIIIIATALLASYSTFANNNKLNGFTRLFNGKNLDNWHGVMLQPYNNPHKRAKLLKEKPKKYKKLKKKANNIMKEHWKVIDKVLTFDGSKDGFSLGSNKKYNNFELYVSWKLAPLGDSGIYLKGVPQIQIWDPSNAKAKKHGANKGSGGLWNNTKTKKGRFPLVLADNPIGQWNTFFIRMVDNIVTIYLNDKLVVDQAPQENTHFGKGKLPLFKEEQLELQAHGSKVEFKDIYIKEIP